MCNDAENELIYALNKELTNVELEELHNELHELFQPHDIFDGAWNIYELDQKTNDEILITTTLAMGACSDEMCEHYNDTNNPHAGPSCEDEEIFECCCGNYVDITGHRLASTYKPDQLSHNLKEKGTTLYHSH